MLGRLPLVRIASLVLLTIPSLLLGQATETRQTWALQHIRSGWCVDFLMDSSNAIKQLPDGYKPVAASSVQLRSGVRRLVADEPTYATWIPASFCAFFADTITIDGRQVSDKKLKDAQAFAWWSIASVTSGQDSSSRGAVVLLASNNWRTQKPAETALIPVVKAEIQISKVPESTDDRYAYNEGKTQILFDGHPAVDSVGVPSALKESYSSRGLRGTSWHLTLALDNLSARPLVGAFRVEGNDDLARALRASPVRFVGPVYSGGNGTVTFYK
ncbi:MAG: hypothetical protein ABJD11_06760 [Gemmatimonadota bacterium]